MDCSSVTTVDQSALKLVKRVIKKYQEKQILLLFSNWFGVDEDGQRVMKHLKFEDVLGQQNIFADMENAVQYAKEYNLKKREEKHGDDGEKGEKGESKEVELVATTMGKGVKLCTREDGTEVIELQWKLANESSATLYRPTSSE